jgi:hypothetical protein
VVVSLLCATIAFGLFVYSLYCTCDRILARRLAFGTGALLALLALSARAASLPAVRESVARAPGAGRPAGVVTVAGPALGPADDAGRTRPPRPVVAVPAPTRATDGEQPRRSLRPVTPARAGVAAPSGPPAPASEPHRRNPRGEDRDSTSLASGRRDRGQPPRGEQVEGPRGLRVERAGRIHRTERAERRDHPERPEDLERPVRPERPERPDRGERLRPERPVGR